MRNSYRILMAKSLGKRPLGRPRRKLENASKKDLGRFVLRMDGG
jgi:hypothetical protein